MGKERRACTGGLVALTLLTLLALAACAPAATATAGSGPETGTTSDPLPFAPRLYQTPTPTVTPLPAAPDCHASQLAAQFWLGGVGAGNMFATILLRNISSTACSMEGSQRLYGVAANGARVATSVESPLPPLARVVLPPQTPAAPLGVDPAPGAYLEIVLIAEYRDDFSGASTNGLCAPANEVTPARFAVVIGPTTLRVVNYDPVAGWAGIHAIEGCHGAISGGGAFLSPQ